VALEGNALRHDVAQVTVSFDKHRMVDPTAVEDETRRLLKRRAFDHLLTLALAGIAEAHGERGDLQRERDLLRSKMAALAAGNWGSASDTEGKAGEAPPDPRALERRIKDIDAQLSTLSTGCCRRISTSWSTCWPGQSRTCAASAPRCALTVRA